MAGEVVAKKKQVINWAWQGAQGLQELLDKHDGPECMLIEDAREEKQLLDDLRHKALVMASDTIELTADEVAMIGSIADSSFFFEWKADFEAEFGVAK